MSNRIRWIAVVSFAAAAGACGGRAKPAGSAADTLTTRERQEAIGRSGIPGATGIGKALEVADSAAARAALVDSVR